MRGKEIWGNWVPLSEERIGFQTLMHKNYYRPQYAIIRKGDSDKMDYIVSDANYFIEAKRVPLEGAKQAVEILTAPGVIWPSVD